MVRTFYHRLINTALLLIGIVIGIIVLVQNNHLEKLELKKVNAQKKQALTGSSGDDRSGIGGNRNPADGSLWAESAHSGLLETDRSAWLPADHTVGGTLKLLMSSDPKGFNYLIENSVDVSTIGSYNRQQHDRPI